MLYRRKEFFAQAGLTLISLLITLTLVSILGALSVPSYMVYVQRTEMHEARNMLMVWQAEQIRFRLGNGEYAKTEALSVVSAADYVFSVTEASVNDYTLQAKRTLLLNDGCDTLTVTGSGSYLPAECWR